MEISIKKCNDLIPPLAEKVIGKLKVAVYAWHHCNKIEATLLNLRNHRVCHRRFTVSITSKHLTFTFALLNTFLDTVPC